MSTYVSFHNHNPQWNVRYRCCCNSMHVQTGALVIGGLHFTQLALLFVVEIILYFENLTTIASLVFGSVVPPSGIAVVGLMCHGIHRRKRSFLIPHLVLQILGILGMVFLAFLTMAALFVNGRLFALCLYGGKTTDGVELSTGILVIIMLTFAIMAGLEIYFFIVVKSCFDYFRDLELSESSLVHVPGISYLQVPPTIPIVY